MAFNVPNRSQSATLLRGGFRPTRSSPLLVHLLVIALPLCVTATLRAQSAPVATVRLTPGWTTFGQALPRGAATGGLQVGMLATQTDVKTTWPDGSIRFAIVSVKPATAGVFAMTPAAQPAGGFAPAVPAASVILTIGGVAYTAALPTAPGPDVWLSGPLVSEWRSTVAPVSSADGHAHAFLRVIFDARMYCDGAARVDVTVENTLDTVGAATLTYDAAITVDGAPAFTQRAVQHPYLTRWRKTFAVGSTAFGSATPDLAAFTRANAIPRYLSSIGSNVMDTGAIEHVGILRYGAADPFTSDRSSRAEQAPLPDWTARYLVHADPAQRTLVLANGDLSGSWPIHVREAEAGGRRGVGTGRFLSLDERPDFWLDERAQSAGLDAVQGTPLPRIDAIDAPTAMRGRVFPDIARQPSLAFVPYLLTGDRYYADEMAFWANYGMMRLSPVEGFRSTESAPLANELRGFGWALRNLADAAAFYPESSAVNGYLSRRLIATLRRLDAHTRAENPVTNPFQIVWVDRRAGGDWLISPSDQTQLAYAITRANALGFAGGLAERDAIARLHLELFATGPDYSRAAADAASVAVGASSARASPAAGTFFTTAAEMWSGTVRHDPPFAGFHGAEARIDLMYGIENGWPGAQAAYDDLWPFVGATPAPCAALAADVPELTCRAGWALDFSSPTAPTAAAATIASPSPGSTLSSDSQIFTWNPGVGVSSYQITVGTAQGAHDIYSSPAVTNLSAFVGGLPARGAIWVRLASFVDNGWRVTDSSYAAGVATAAGAAVSATSLDSGSKTRISPPGASPLSNLRTGSVPGTAASPAGVSPLPLSVGSLIAGTFNDASGHSAQSHLVYAPNARVWWLFTLSSAHDSLDDHTVRSYVSSGPDLSTATWTAAAPSPHLADVNGATNSLFAGGRSLGAAVLSIAGSDYAHVFASAAFDGQASSNGHIRAQLGASAITWGSWDNPGLPTSASQWQGPPGTGDSGSSTHSPWGNVVAISTGGFIHHSSVTMDQEADCNVARSTNADVSATWTNGFGSRLVGNSPPDVTAVIDKSMTFECKAAAFAPLASDVMLAVYSNGAVAQPNLTNLRFQRSGAKGTWTNIAASGGGNGTLFTTDAFIDSNDWGLVPLSTTAVYAFRRNAAGTAVEGASYTASSNTWSPLSPQPPAFGAGQGFKRGAGLFGATDGSSIWIVCINTDSANSLLYSRFDGRSWTPWTTVPGTDVGTHVRGFISGYPRVAANQIGLIWTEGSTAFDVVATALNIVDVLDTTAPAVSMTAPAGGATVSGSAVTVSAAASDNIAVAGVQFKLDGADLGPELTFSPYTVTWDTSAAANGLHTLTAVARDAANNATTAIGVAVAVSSDRTPPAVSIIAPADGATVSAAAVTVSASATDNSGVAGVQFLLDGAPLGAERTSAPYAVAWDTTSAAASVHTLAARARDAANNQTTSAAVSVTLVRTPADTVAPAVTATPPPGSFTSAQRVTLTASEPAAIYFTVDGSAPSRASAPYAAAIAIAATQTIRYLAVDPSGNSSTGSLAYTIVPSGPAQGPVASAPVPGIELHSTLTTTAVPVTLTWSATIGTAGSAVAKYELQQSIDRGGTWTAIALPTPLTRSLVLNIVPSDTASYAFRVRAADAAGTVGAFATGLPFTVAASQESSPAITYAGSWPIAARADAFGGSTSSSSAAGSAAIFTFNGTYIAWVTEKDAAHGQVTVSVDGVATPMIDNYSATTRTRRVMFVQALAPGSHRIAVTVLAGKTAASTGTRTDIDSFVVFGDGSAPPPATLPTTITIAAPPVIGPVDGVVTVAVASTGGTPAGTVSLSADGGVPQVQPLVNGIGRFSVASPLPGVHTLTASYAAQSGFGASTATGSLLVSRAPTTTGIVAPSVTSPANASVKVTVSSAGFTPGGAVTLSVDGGTAATQTLLDGAATFDIVSPAAGTHALSAAYVAQRSFAASAASGTLAVSAPATGLTVTAPVPTVAANATLATVAVPVTLTWSGTGGITRYELQQSFNNGASYAALSLPSATATSITLSLAPSAKNVFRYRVRATNAAGIVSTFAAGAGFMVSAAQENSAAISYMNAWPIAPLANGYGGSTAATATAGSSATFTFTGSYIAWVSPKDTAHGQADVWIDGVKQATVDLYNNAGTTYRRVAFSRPVPAGTHTVQVRVLGTKNAASKGARVDVDAFIVLQ
jgi:Big-like domain-containing protein/chitobiase/beta-hexosaminidase-like protein